MKHRRIVLLALAALLLLSGCCGTEQTETIGDTLTVYCFEAGKADAFLLYADGFTVLIDTGESGFGKTIVAKLNALGISRLDYLILTHFDKDHVGGAKKILESVEVGTVLQSNFPKEDASAYEKYVEALNVTGLTPVTVREDLTFSLGGVTFTVNPPARETYAADESNNSSLIVSVTHGDNRLLFLGDAEDLRLAEFLETNPGVYDLVKLPHHGQYQSTLEDLLAQATPSLGVITSSDDEPEDDETVTLLKKAGVRTLLTREGAITVVSDGRTLDVTQE